MRYSSAKQTARDPSSVSTGSRLCLRFFRSYKTFQVVAKLPNYASATYQHLCSASHKRNTKVHDLPVVSFPAASSANLTPHSVSSIAISCFTSSGPAPRFSLNFKLSWTYLNCQRITLGRKGEAQFLCTSSIGTWNICPTTFLNSERTRSDMVDCRCCQSSGNGKEGGFS
jgi:hypothetical protein